MSDKMKYDSLNEDMILIHGDITTEELKIICNNFLSDSIYQVIGPPESIISGKVQIVVHVSKVIDIDWDTSLISILESRCNLLDDLNKSIKCLNKEVDHYGFDILIEFLMTRFTILFVSPIEYFKEGLIMLETDINQIARSVQTHGYIKYLVTGKDSKRIDNFRELKALYQIKNIIW